MVYPVTSATNTHPVLDSLFCWLIRMYCLNCVLTLLLPFLHQYSTDKMVDITLNTLTWCNCVEAKFYSICFQTMPFLPLVLPGAKSFQLPHYVSHASSSPSCTRVCALFVLHAYLWLCTPWRSSRIRVLIKEKSSSFVNDFTVFVS